MVITEEQRRRMEENRKRALEIRKRKQLEKEKNESISAGSTANKNVFREGGFVAAQPTELENNKKIKTSHEEGAGKEYHDANKKNNASSRITEHSNRTKITDIGGGGGDISDEESLEEFEYNASPYISQTEAQRTYCVPLGTLAVCNFIEKENPHHRGFSKMKLYLRSEVRRRARKRFGGKEGLVREREKRSKKRFEKDLAEVKDVFR